MKQCSMRANFDISRTSVNAAVLRAGIKIVTTHPQEDGHLQIVGLTAVGLSGDTGQCTTATIANTRTTMKLIALLHDEGKDCLISCKSVGY